MPEPAVRVTTVSKRYANNATVLHDVTFSVDPGAIVTLAGSNGSGKTTLLRCIAGLASFTGSIDVLGRPVDGRAGSRASLGYLPQAVTLPHNSTIDEAIRFFARLRGADPSRLQLPDGFLRDGGTLIGTLSGGQRQRVAIAVSMLGDPEVLLLDEPVANLDEDSRGVFWQVVRDLCEQGTTALVASPSPSDLAGIDDRVISLRDGRIVGDTLDAGEDARSEADPPTELAPCGRVDDAGAGT